MDTVRTDRNGVASSKPLPLGRYKIIESKAAMYYALDTTPIEVEIEFSGQIVRAAMTNKSLYTNVSIKKTGYSEAMPGQSIAYTLTNIGNNSNASLTSFYWRDTLPVQAVRLDKIITGTWNARGNYKIVYRTNNSGENWRTLSDNLSTSKNYVLDASATALGLAAGEYVGQLQAGGVSEGNLHHAPDAGQRHAVHQPGGRGRCLRRTVDHGYLPLDHHDLRPQQAPAENRLLIPLKFKRGRCHNRRRSFAVEGR